MECKEKFGKSWTRCHITETADTTARVTDIVANKTYEFRVRAYNKAGEGEPSQPTGMITCKSRFVKPFIVGDRMADLVVKRGQTLTWDLRYGGEPDPEVEWFAGPDKDNCAEQLVADER